MELQLLKPLGLSMAKSGRIAPWKHDENQQVQHPCKQCSFHSPYNQPEVLWQVQGQGGHGQMPRIRCVKGDEPQTNKALFLSSYQAQTDPSQALDVASAFSCSLQKKFQRAAARQFVGADYKNLQIHKVSFSKELSPRTPSSPSSLLPQIRTHKACLHVQRHEFPGAFVLLLLLLQVCSGMCQLVSGGVGEAAAITYAEPSGFTWGPPSAAAAPIQPYRADDQALFLVEYAAAACATLLFAVFFNLFDAGTYSNHTRSTNCACVLIWTYPQGPMFGTNSTAYFVM